MADTPINVDTPTKRAPDDSVFDPTMKFTDDLGRIISEQMARSTPRGIQAMPPQYYFPNLTGQDVMIGNVSGAMGSIPIYSPGAPMMPYSVLDAQMIAKQEARQKFLDLIGKDFPEIQDMQLEDPNKTIGFQDWHIKGQNEIINKHIDLQKLGILGYEEARGQAKRELTEWNSRSTAMKVQLDATYELAMGVWDTSQREEYVSPEAMRAAKEYKDIVMDKAHDFDNIEDLYNALADVRKTLVKSDSMQNASELLRQTINDTKIADDFITRTMMLNPGGGLSAARSNIQQKFDLYKRSGLAAYSSSDEMAARLFDMIDTSWEANYRAQFEKGETAVPTKSEYEQYVLGHLEAGIEKDVVNLQNSDAMNQVRAREWQRRQREIGLNTHEEMITTPFGQFTFTATSLPDGAKISTGEVVYVDKNGNVKRGVVNGDVVKYGHINMNGKLTYVAEVFVPEGTSYKVTGDDGKTTTVLSQKGGESLIIPYEAATNVINEFAMRKNINVAQPMEGWSSLQDVTVGSTTYTVPYGRTKKTGETNIHGVGKQNQVVRDRGSSTSSSPLAPTGGDSR